jgi:hypothetical protein
MVCGRTAPTESLIFLRQEKKKHQTSCRHTSKVAFEVHGEPRAIEQPVLGARAGGHKRKKPVQLVC